jgi:hypothetical protein
MGMGMPSYNQFATNMMPPGGMGMNMGMGGYGTNMPQSFGGMNNFGTNMNAGMGPLPNNNYAAGPGPKVLDSFKKDGFNILGN